MKQVIQESGTGVVRLEDVPAPVLRPGGVLVRTRHSVISIGTERMKLDFGRKTLLGKARERPEQVRTVLETAAREGVVATYRKVRARLAELSSLGYSLAGVVEAVGAGVRSLEVGDVVACAGAGYANHAELVWVPENLVVRVPDGVTTEAAAFATIGAIGLHGVRQAELQLGECAAVVGLGLIGQLTVQMLRAAGIRVVAVDVDPARVALAARHGATAVLRRDDVEGTVRMATGGIGVDATIITAATSSDDPIRIAGRITRDRGRVVIVGAVPIRVPRSPYYEKEIDVRLSRSYGPGRYDASYEEKGHDYPIGYVRWTERRNLAEFVRLVGDGAVRLDDIITHRFPFSDAERAYAELSGGGGALGVVLEYPESKAPEPRRIPLHGGTAAEGAGSPRAGGDRPGIGLVGAGSFATATLLPLLKKLPVQLHGVATAGGVSARDAAEKFGFSYMAGSPDELFADPDVAAVVIATRHADHAALAAAALRAGKAVFVEKPLAIDEAGLSDVAGAAAGGAQLLVGFNRRFAPATAFLRDCFSGVAGARVVHIRVNAGEVPADSWVHDPEVGGGRLVGEGCHFIDLARSLVGAPVTSVLASSIGGADPAAKLQDNVQVTLHFADGSLASVLYTSKGTTKSGKERVEMYAGGRSGVIDDFRSAEFHGPDGRQRWKGTQDKGHAAELKAFVEALRAGSASPIPLDELLNSSRATLAAARSLASGSAEPA
jgi:predicted dehydrogenase/threonine dehydrogenase-like Zn-dependent dehydrogenase